MKRRSQLIAAPQRSYAAALTGLVTALLALSVLSGCDGPASAPADTRVPII